MSRSHQARRIPILTVVLLVAIMPSEAGARVAPNVTASQELTRLARASMPGAQAVVAAARVGFSLRRQTIGDPRLLEQLTHTERSLSIAERLARPARDASAIARSIAAAMIVDRVVPRPSVAAPASEAVQTMLGGRALTGAQARAVSALDDLSPDVSLALGRTLAAYGAYDAAARAAFAPGSIARLARAGADLDELAAQTRAAYSVRDGTANVNPPVVPLPALEAAGIDLTGVRAARASLLEAVGELHLVLALHQPAAQDPIDVPPLLHIDLGATDDLYETDYALLIDGGGNDRYHNNAGGSSLDQGSGYAGTPNCALTARAAGALVDLGGNDLYGTAERRGCGVVGGGNYGSGLLVDTAGDDGYWGAEAGSMGGGYRGIGLLVDASGNDSYLNTSTVWGAGTNGGATEGAGLLVDGDGDDVYLAKQGGSNGGGNLGEGALVDLGGTDAYRARTETWDPIFNECCIQHGLGVNGGGWVGSGFLYDGGSGDDVYDAGGTGSNGGAESGTGFLFDEAGSDRYIVTRDRYPSPGQNGGGSLGVGFLSDGGGDDRYDGDDFAVNGGSVGGMGFLIDGGGNDAYTAKWISVNGGAAGGGGFLADLAGDDVFESTGLLMEDPAFPEGYGKTYSTGANGGGAMLVLQFVVGQPGLGFLFDGSGSDRYLAHYWASNGGAGEGNGFLRDGGGDDLYSAEAGGANGGAATLDHCHSLVAGACGSTALLWDTGGSDSYVDEEGGTGTDRTVAPKGLAGAQLDQA